MDVEDIRMFVAIAEAGSITQAGERLGVSKSVASRRLADLESALGARLFARSTRQMSLTPEGQAFLGRARRVLEELAAANEELGAAKGTLSGRIRITAPSSFGHRYLGPVLLGFAQEHPGIDLSIDFTDRTVDLVGEGYDLAIRIGALVDSGLAARRLAESRRVVVASPALLAALGPPASLDDIEARFPVVAYRNRSLAREWATEGEAAPRAMQPRVRLHTDSGQLAVDAAVRGLGITITPTFLAAADIAAGRLVAIELPGLRFQPDTLFVLRPADRAPPLRVRRLVDRLVDAFADPPPWDRGLAPPG